MWILSDARTWSAAILLAMTTACTGGASDNVISTPVPNHPPEVEIAFPSPGSRLYPGDAPWRFEGRVQDPDASDPLLLAVSWRLERQGILDSEQTALPASDGTVVFDAPYLEEAAYQLELSARDPQGLVTRKSVSFEVANLPPEVTVTSPLPYANVYQWQPVVVEGRVSDPDGPRGADIRVTLSDSVSGEVATVTAGTDGLVSFEYVPSREGKIQLVLTAVDELSARGVGAVYIQVAGCDDADGDGYYSCGPEETAVDCNDQDPQAYPGATERCNGVDDDCDGIVPSQEYDLDNDGQAPCEGDCTDSDPLTYAGANELCDGFDNDCDGAVPSTEQDNDGDGYRGCGTSSAAADCDDMVWSVHPGAPEVCNGRDDDCDGQTGLDEADVDGDGWMSCSGDCDDSDCHTYPGAQERLDLVDNDCDGVVEGMVTTEAAFAVIKGMRVEAHLGFSLGAGGDLNGDGIGDLVIGAPWDDVPETAGTYEGSVVLVFGRAADWCDDAEAPGAFVVLEGDEAGARAGSAVSIAGDINGDGLADVLVGAPNHATGVATDAGAAYLIPGRETWMDALIADAALTVVEGSSAGMYLGTAFSGPGDIDGDGAVDVAIGAPWWERRPVATGMVVLLSERPFGWPNRTSVATLPRFVGTGNVGVGVSLAFGHATRDERSGLLIGGSGETGVEAGVVYWLPGQDTARQGQQALEDLGAARYDGTAVSARVGWSVASGVDVDGDGLEDALIGVGANSGDASEAAYLLFGTDPLPLTGTLDAVADVRFSRTESDRCPCAVVGLPDWNGDGLGDLAIGVALASGDEISAGRVYLFLGRAGRDAWPATLSLEEADAVLEGATAGEQAGYALAAGDFNGDGFSDLAVGSPTADVQQSDGTLLPGAGKVSIFLGRGR